MVIHGWQTNGGAARNAPLETHGARARHLVVHDELVEVVLASRAAGDRERRVGVMRHAPGIDSYFIATSDQER